MVYVLADNFNVLDVKDVERSVNVMITQLADDIDLCCLLSEECKGLIQVHYLKRVGTTATYGPL